MVAERNHTVDSIDIFGCPAPERSESALSRGTTSDFRIVKNIVGILMEKKEEAPNEEESSHPEPKNENEISVADFVIDDQPARRHGCHHPFSKEQILSWVYALLQSTSFSIIAACLYQERQVLSRASEIGLSVIVILYYPFFILLVV